MPTININTALQMLRTELQEIESRIMEGQVTYDPRRRRGRGSFGDVYLGQHEGTNVCVKVLSMEGGGLELKSWQKFLRVLKREVKVWRGLDHQNVVRFIGWMLEEGEGEMTVSLISSWCGGGNVKDYLREHSSADRHELICGVSRGLAYLHSQDIVHGDIRPTNIVVAHSGEASDNAQLCDFGLSCILSDISTHAYSSSIAASSRYASPELLSASETRRTRESDIWAFGCTSAEILTDRAPFSSIMNEWAIPFLANSQLPYDRKDDDEFWTQITNCFERVPEKRPSMDKLGRCLELALPPSRAIIFLRHLLHLRQLDNLPSSWKYRLNKNIPELTDAYRKIVSTHVQTVCREWCDVVCELPGGDAEVSSGILEVVPILFHWVAAMSIMGEVEKALVGLFKLRDWVRDDGLKELLYDLHRMVLQSRLAIRACSLSVLCSSHPFVPRGSILRSRFPAIFSGDMLGIIAPGLTDLGRKWPLLLIKLQHTHHIRTVTFSPNGRYLAFIPATTPIWICDMATGMTSCVLKGLYHWVTSAAFSSDSRYLAFNSSRSALIWDVVTGMASEQFAGHTGDVESVAFSPDSRYLASGSYDNSVRIWDVDTGMTSRVLNGHTRAVKSVAFSPDSRSLASGSEDNSVRIWDVDTGMTSRVLNGHTQWVRSVTFSPDSRYLASGSDDNSVRIWDVDTGMTSRVLNGDTDFVRSVAFSPDSRYLASGSRDRSVRMWDVDTGMTSRVFNDHVGSVESAAFSLDSRYVAFASENEPVVRILDIDNGMTSPVLNGHTNPVTSVAFSPDRHYLASLARHESVRIWDLVTWASVSRNLDSPRGLWFSSDGAFVAVSLSSREILYLDTATLQDIDPRNPQLYEPSTSLEPFPSIQLKGQSLCVQRGETRMPFCWLPSYITVNTPIARSGNLLALGARGGEVIMVDLSHFRLPEVEYQ